MLEKINKFGKTKFFSKVANPLYNNKNDKFLSLLFPENLPQNKKVCGGARYQDLFKNSLNKFPLISIIMPNYKGKNLSKAIDSILNQNYPNIELIIIDGNSGEEVTSLLEKYENEHRTTSRCTQKYRKSIERHNKDPKGTSTSAEH